MSNQNQLSAISTQLSAFGRARSPWLTADR